MDYHIRIGSSTQFNLGRSCRIHASALSINRLWRDNKDVSQNLPKVTLNLVGLDGNAFNLLGQFRRAARRDGWNEDQIREVTEEATRSDYDHLLQTLIAHTEPPADDE